jgi:iron complex outermembrane receptor protein
MRTLFILLLTPFTLALSAGAQTITGSIKSTKGASIGSATISLLKASDSTIVMLQVSNEEGAFRFTGVKDGHYIVTVSSVGYSPGSSPTFALTGKGVQLPVIILQEAEGKMKGVTITAKKPLVQVKGDRTILNVEGTINAVGSTVLELMRKSPGVSVDQDDRIAMNGKNGVQVFIDGRPTPLAGSDLAAYLKSIQSSEVGAIELITHPSAKYEAAGNAGIINIRLKKNKAFGTNGSVTTGYNQGIYGKYNTGLALNHRTAKVNVFGNLGYSAGITQKKMAVNRQLIDSVFAQWGTLNENSKTVSMKAGVDYFINKRNTAGFLANGNFGNTRLTNNSYTTIASVDSLPSRILKADNRFSSNRNHLDFNLNYFYAGEKEKTLNVNADYGFYNMKGAQLQPNYYYDGSGQTLTNTVTYEMITPTKIDIYSAKGDYEQPLRKGKLATGVKISYVKTDNDFQRYNVDQNGKALDYDRSNRFVYRENINAAYINYNRQWKRIYLQAGLRAENTAMNGTSTFKKERNGTFQNYDSTIQQNYINLFPSVSINYSQNTNHQFSLSLSRRIDRPAYQDLNPFELKVDDYLVQSGNAYLRPQYTTGMGMTYVYKQKLNASVNYSSVKDLAAWILDTTETSKSVASRQNLASQKVVSLNTSYPFQHKNYKLFANLNTAYSAFEGSFGTGRTINEEAFTLNLYVQNSLEFAETWTAELTAFYYSPSVQEGNIRAEAFWSMDAGVQTRISDDKLTLKLSVSDMFNTLQFKSRSFFAGQIVNYNTKNETRQLKLSLAFRMGSKDVEGARQRKSGAEEEIKRVN